MHLNRDGIFLYKMFEKSLTQNIARESTLPSIMSAVLFICLSQAMMVGALDSSAYLEVTSYLAYKTSTIYSSFEKFVDFFFTFSKIIIDTLFHTVFSQSLYWEQKKIIHFFNGYSVIIAVCLRFQIILQGKYKKHLL